MQRQIAAALFCLCAALTPPAAADVFDAFESFISHPAAKITFRQTTRDSQGKRLETTAGFLAYRRPGKFRLEYRSPDIPLIVSNGETLWLYEADLEQVVIQAFDDAQKNALLEIITAGSVAALKRRYVLTAGLGSGAGDNLRWLNANALSEDSVVRHVGLGFAGAGGADNTGGELKKATITDHYSNTIDMTITEVNFADKQSDDLFTFTPPAGSNVIER